GRTLFAWLGGFAAGARLDDLETVARRLGLDDTLGALTELVDTGLVRVAADDRQARYSLPDMVAELAVEHLAGRADRVAVEAAVAARFLDRVRTREHHPRDVDNLRAAVTWTVEHRPADLDAALVDLLGRYFEQSGRFVEGDAVLRRI